MHQEWVDHITDDHPNVMNVVQGSRSSYGDDMGAFLCFMAVRLLAMRRVLKPTGSIYLHCDPTASHYLKELMDAVFGRKNFQNELIWYYSWGMRTEKRWNRKHDVLFLYVKNPKAFVFNAQSVLEARQTSESTRTRLRYKGAMITDGNKGRGKEKLALPSDVFYIATINGMAKERVGYPTQKPIALYERIILASSNKGDVVLDPFAGCATTCVAAERLGRQWVGIDIWDEAYQTVVDRLRGEGELFGKVHYTPEPPERTDDGETTSPFLRVKVRVKEPDGPRWSRAKMYEHLLEQNGPRCQGCDRKFDDPRYLELDHNTPRADGAESTTSRTAFSFVARATERRATSTRYRGFEGSTRIKDGWLDDHQRRHYLDGEEAF